MLASAVRLLVVASLLAVGCQRRADDPKRRYMDEIQQASMRNGEDGPLENVLVYGKASDPCGRVEADQKGLRFTGTVCCDEGSGRCRLRWNPVF